jgi:uncharacterized protein (DUF983 family)
MLNFGRECGERGERESIGRRRQGRQPVAVALTVAVAVAVALTVAVAVAVALTVAVAVAVAVALTVAVAVALTVAVAIIPLTHYLLIF